MARKLSSAQVRVLTGLATDPAEGVGDARRNTVYSLHDAGLIDWDSEGVWLTDAGKAAVAAHAAPPAGRVHMRVASLEIEVESSDPATLATVVGFVRAAVRKAAS
jgi:hypothetical protein